jgi:hypothetical protein
MVREMVREELQLARKTSRMSSGLKEAISVSEIDPDEINPIFMRMRPADRNAMVSWIMRYFFSPKKKDQPWWSSKITPKNVLAYISHPKSGFPLSPREVVDDWSIKKSLKSDISNITDQDIEAFEKNEPVNNTGEKTLKDIGDALGITGVQARNIEMSALDKLKTLLGGKNPLSMDEDELDRLFANVEAARRKVSVEFAKALKDAGGDIKAFLKGLVAKNILGPADVKLLTQQELEMLMFLMDQPESEIALYLRGDAAKADNKIKSFQAAVARALSPVRPRGRPKKSSD